MTEQANYHINLWPEPPGPATYLCLLCPVKDCTEADILLHVTTVHEITPVPTPMAADVTLVSTLLRKEAPDASPDVLDRDVH